MTRPILRFTLLFVTSKLGSFVMIPHRMSRHSTSPDFQVSNVPSLPTNLVFVKLLKVGGSTAGGIMRRIAAHRQENGVFDKNFPSLRTEPAVWVSRMTVLCVDKVVGEIAEFPRSLLLPLLLLVRIVFRYLCLSWHLNGETNVVRSSFFPFTIVFVRIT